ncbi:MAG: hypothetical protein ACI4CC_10010 [Lachnospiraceae bacterium]
MKFKDRVARAMYGRYGNDELNRMILVLSMVLLVVSAFGKVGGLYLLAVALLILSYYRMLSRNVSKRYAENQKYLTYKNKITGWFRIRKLHLKQRKEFHFFKCPACGQKVRVPKGKGMIEITCPKCRNSFRKRS